MLMLTVTSLVAMDQTFNASPRAVVTIPKQHQGFFEKLIQRETKADGKIERVEGFNSQAWTTQIGGSPNFTLFPDPVNHESQLDLFSMDWGWQP